MTGYQALVKNDGPLAYWPLQETSGTDIRDIVGAYHGTLTGDVALDEAGLRQDGAPAADFENQNGYIDLGVVPAFSPAGNLPFSIEAWVQPRREFVNGTNYEIFGNELFQTYGVLLRIEANHATTPTAGRVHARTNQAGTASLLDTPFTPAINLNQAAHLAWTFDGANGFIYINGALAVGPIAMTTAVSSAIATTIGAARFAPQRFNGLIQDVAFYEREISALTIRRHYAFRTHTNRLYVTVNGVHRATHKDGVERGIECASFQVSDPLNEQPTTAQFRAWGFSVSPGARVQAYYEGAPTVRFSGNAIATTEGYLLKPSNLFTAVDCEDDTWRLNTRKVNEYFTTTDPGVIALALAEKYATGVPTHQIQTGFAPLDEITFTNEDLTTCFTRLAQRAGTVWRRGVEDEGIIFGEEDTTEVPTPLDAAHPSLESIAITRRIRDRITRMTVEGGGGTMLSEVAVGESIIPVSDAFWYPAAGGRVQVGPQRLAYTGVHPGGGGGLVGPGASPSSPPTLGFADGAGVDDGAHDVAVVYVTGTGRSLPSPAATFVVGAIPPPAAAPAAGTPTSGGAVTGGTHQYAFTEVTPAGETEPSALSNTITALATVSAPGAPALFSGGTHRFNGGLDPGAVYGYKVTFWDGGSRETEAGTAGLVTLSNPLANAGAIEVAAAPAPPSGFVRRWWRTEGNGAVYKLLGVDGDFSDTSVGFWIDIKSDNQLGANAPSVNTTTRATVAVTVPGNSAFATDRHLYRTEAGGSTLKLVAAVGASLMSTPYVDTMADGSLGGNAPSSAPTANQIAVSAIPLGQSGVVLERELYMSPAGGGPRTRALVIADNSTTTGTITMSDATLAGQMAEPTVDTSGLSQPQGQVLPGATAVPLTGSYPDEGWVQAGSQVLRYTSKTATELQGVPASGPGAVHAAISYNTTIAATPQLTGITTGSPVTDDGIRFAIATGTDVNILAILDDVDAQLALGALLVDEHGNPTSGVIEGFHQDRRWSYDQAVQFAQAYLDLYSTIQPEVTAAVRDPKAVAGRKMGIDMPTFPTPLEDEIRIQHVEVDQFGIPEPSTFPLHTVTASSALYTAEQLLRQLRDSGTVHEQ